ncbi:hypothetical protein TBLA_0I02110 [Henningerozyma blattae CBS 6284]|uniref:Endoplasmic reticulum lectin n=1 Tax=Henningerozyma blattae (strain ATCC 34711 / CBS 6284 / DSM 70876 / NBRC 10599 / NRRL Y-10934 / UCD 77-7) TaxID=1071380 RepID=I2H917_HENB6|nr:hypothetical protein TBLA_0I02110 [Tetrapisispora blattae CBS 6284]CCH62869.1 hypothetical protein TBLA_0I02110 [Tetrapisispora blattae CBS 6284]
MKLINNSIIYSSLIICYSINQVQSLFAPVQDPFSTDKYSINYISKNKWLSSIENNQTALENGSIIKINDYSKCFIPTNKNSGSNLFQKDLTSDQLDEIYQESLKNAMEIITNDLKGYCMVYANGFWTYQYCIGNSFTQFHGVPGTTNSLFYTLGRAPPMEVDIQNSRRLQKKNKTKKILTHDDDFQLLYNDFEYYISEIIENGQICDLTGLPRVTEVQYVCGSAFGEAAIQWVREVKTCAYEAQIAVPALCDLELLSQSKDKKSAKQIYCTNEEKDITINSKQSISDVLPKYSPYFLGHGLYLLNPHENIPELNTSVILYTGDVDLLYDEQTTLSDLYAHLSKAIPVMLFHQALTLPNGARFQEGDAFQWIAEIVDMNFNHIKNVFVDIGSDGMANFVIDDKTEFPDEGNFIYVAYGERIDGTKGSRRVKQENKINRPKFKTLKATQGAPTELQNQENENDLTVAYVDETATFRNNKEMIDAIMNILTKEPNLQPYLDSNAEEKENIEEIKIEIIDHTPEFIDDPRYNEQEKEQENNALLHSVDNTHENNLEENNSEQVLEEIDSTSYLARTEISDDHTEHIEEMKLNEEDSNSNIGSNVLEEYTNEKGKLNVEEATENFNDRQISQYVEDLKQNSIVEENNINTAEKVIMDHDNIPNKLNIEDPERPTIYEEDLISTNHMNDENNEIEDIIIDQDWQENFNINKQISELASNNEEEYQHNDQSFESSTETYLNGPSDNTNIKPENTNDSLEAENERYEQSNEMYTDEINENIENIVEDSRKDDENTYDGITPEISSLGNQVNDEQHDDSKQSHAHQQEEQSDKNKQETHSQYAEQEEPDAYMEYVEQEKINFQDQVDMQQYRNSEIQQEEHIASTTSLADQASLEPTILDDKHISVEVTDISKQVDDNYELRDEL